MPALEVEERDALHRGIRDADPDVWEPACHRLGELATTDQAAYSAVCDLLLSGLPELRLKGLVALRIMAPAKPREVLAFLADRVAESRVHHDPVMLDATFFVFAALPKALGQTAVEEYTRDPSDAIRAAAAAALPLWSDWPSGTLLRLARDPSVLVRAGLLQALPEIEDSEERRSALALLRAAAEPHLEALLEEVESCPGDPPKPSGPEPFGEADAEALLATSSPSPALVSRFENWLQDQPERAIALVRQRLEEPGAAPVMEHLGDLCRDPALATLFRAWSRILYRRGGFTAEETVLQVLGILEREPRRGLLSPLRDFVKACADAAECTGSLDLATWACSRQVTTAALSLWSPATLESLSLAPAAQQYLETLAKIGAEFQGLTLFQLSFLTNELSNLAADIEVGCPRPERDLLMLVVKVWRRIVRDELETLMGGGA